MFFFHFILLAMSFELPVLLVYLWKQCSSKSSWKWGLKEINESIHYFRLKNVKKMLNEMFKIVFSKIIK